MTVAANQGTVNEDGTVSTFIILHSHSAYSRERPVLTLVANHETNLELFPHSPVPYSKRAWDTGGPALILAANQETGNEYGTVSTFASSIFTIDVLR
jgi:hypothetical protein